jgi:hypothetical protein
MLRADSISLPSLSSFCPLLALIALLLLLLCCAAAAAALDACVHVDESYSSHSKMY